MHPIITLPPALLSPGIPLLCFLVLLPLNIPWSQISVTWLGVVHFLACLSPQLGSVVYHLFMNHEGGEPVYHTLLKLDVCGICMINTLGETSPARVSRFRPRPSSGFATLAPRPDPPRLLIVNGLPLKDLARTASQYRSGPNIISFLQKIGQCNESRL